MPNHFLEVFLDFLMFSYNFLESVRGHLAIVAKFVVVMYLYGTWVLIICVRRCTWIDAIERPGSTAQAYIVRRIGSEVLE